MRKRARFHFGGDVYIPAATSNLFDHREFLDALQTLEKRAAAASEFEQAIESARAVTDTFPVTSQAPNVDPTSSSLFQAHLGALAPRAVADLLADTPLSSEQQDPLRVTGINAANAAGAFANGQSLQPSAYEPGSSGMEAVQGTRFPTAGAEDSGGFYDALMRSTGVGRPRLGTRLDVKG